MDIYKEKGGVSTAHFNAGDKAYIIDNKIFLREVTIKRITKDFCVIKYVDTGTYIRIRHNRLFGDKKEAENSLPISARPKRRSHWDFL